MQTLNAPDSVVTRGEANPEPQQAGEGSGQRAQPPDPWGVKRAENLLTSLQGVLSARVEVSPIGEVTAVHVLTHSGIAPKQMVRNVESALLAHLGLKVDHRKISIAQTAEVEPIEALERSAIKQESLRREVVFGSLVLRPAGEHRVQVAVTLVAGGQEVSAEADSADTRKAKVQAAARAAVTALDRMLPSGTFELEAVRVLDAFDTQVIVAGVHVLDGREPRLLVGTAVVGESSERAAVLAVLDATNRWVQSRT